MEIVFGKSENYIGYSIKKEQESDSRVALSGASGAFSAQNGQDASRNNENGFRVADQVDISQEARELQKVASTADAENSTDDPYANFGKKGSALTAKLNGDDESDDKRLAFTSAEGGAKSVEQDPDSKIRDLQKQLRAAMKKLTEARQELSDLQNAQARQGKSPTGAEADVNVGDAMSAEQELQAAQAKVAAANAEVNAIQEQLQKATQEKGKGADGGGGPTINVGSRWQPQGGLDVGGTGGNIGI